MTTIASCVLGLSPRTADGTPAQDAEPEFWRDQFAAIAGEGFDAVEVNDSWLKPAQLTGPRRADLVAAAGDAGLRIAALHIQRVSPIAPEVGEQNLAYGHASIDAAAELGVGTYSTGLHQPLTAAQQRALWFWTVDGPRDPIDDADTWRTAVERVRDWGRHAAQLGMRLALELYEDTYLGTADSAVRFVQDVALDNVGLNPDVGNLIRLHRPVEDWRELYAKTLPYANYWHLKNYQRDERGDGSFPVAFPSTLRDGIINYRGVVAQAVALGYDGIYTCEHYGGDSIGVCGENRRYLQTLLR
ncbi:sugar phosphate isomerase/epimerase family protein [Microbacterium sp.]|uniref:sugar phosphate isomerase/epimerase family protein n=1 Tax=Microbacterium sp. TaxID=51671 RepID=UPI003A88D107